MPTSRTTAALLAALLLLVPAVPSMAQEPAAGQSEGKSADTADSQREHSLFKDPEDGWLDGSEWLLSKTGFIPFPIIITEPAVDNGLGLALGFIHPPKGTGAEVDPLDEDWTPSMTALVGLYTGNDSWFAGGGHFGAWRGDRIRYSGFAGAMSFNLRFRVFEEDFRYNIEGAFLYQELQFRLARSNWFLGGSFLLIDNEVEFDLGLDIPGIEPIELDSIDAGLGLTIEYDALDNFFTASNGLQIEGAVVVYSESLGGDFDYQDYELEAQYFNQVAPAWVLATRLKGDAIEGDAPFYALPFVDMRGVEVMRYQGQEVAQVELEARWDFHRRFSLIGFGGVGKAYGFPSDEELVEAAGLGVRYLAARQLGLRIGVDVAWGPDGVVPYIQAGHAW